MSKTQIKIIRKSTCVRVNLLSRGYKIIKCYSIEICIICAVVRGKIAAIKACCFVTRDNRKHEVLLVFIIK